MMRGIDDRQNSILWLIGALLCLFATLLVSPSGISFSWVPDIRLEKVGPAIDSLESIVTILAILAGLWWFIARRERSPRANVSHDVTFASLDPSIVYVGVSVTIKNTGRVVIRPKVTDPIASVVTIEELSPYLGAVQESQELSPEYKMKFLGQRTFPKRICIEPGEQQTILFEFIIQSSTRSIKVYSHIDNSNSDGIGWDHTTIHEVAT